MTKKHDEPAPEEPVLGTGAQGDPAHPDDVKPVGYENIPEQPVVEHPEPAAHAKKAKHDDEEDDQ